MQTLNEEFDSLTDMEACELGKPPPDREVIKTKRVFDFKSDGSGNISRYRARLVAKGFSQTQGIDFQVFSPVP